MFDVFKKYVIKNDRKLLPVLDEMKLFEIKFLDFDERSEEYENLEIKREDKVKIYDTFQLPNEVTGIESKDIFVLVIDKYKNQKGLKKERCIYLLLKMDINLVDGVITCRYNSGLSLFTVLIGLQLEEDETIFERTESLNNYQLKLLRHISTNGKKYILYKMQTTNESIINLSKTFTIINKKRSKKCNVENKVFDDKEYFENIIIPYIRKFVVNLFWTIDCAQNSRVKIKETKNKCIIELKRQKND